MRMCLVAVLALTLVCLSSLAVATPVIVPDQRGTVPNGLPWNTELTGEPETPDLGQTFISGERGLLRGVELEIWLPPSITTQAALPEGDVRVNIFRASGGRPVGPSLATQMLSLADLVEGQFLGTGFVPIRRTQFSFHPWMSPFIEVGDRLAITLDADAPVLWKRVPVSEGSNVINFYAGGSALERFFDGPWQQPQGYDLGFLTLADIAATRAVSLPGDLNEDGSVDGSDFEALRDSFGRQGPFGLTQLGLVEFAIIKENFSRQVAVPEPATWLLATAGFVLLGGRLLGRRRADAATR